MLSSWCSNIPTALQCLPSREEECDLEELIGLLHELGTDTKAHTNRVLMDHLIGVFELLKAWGNTPSICKAGLFHSIYGTTFFKDVSVDVKSQRKSIQEAIGEEAEQLVYYFCACNRKKLVKQMKKQVLIKVEEEEGDEEYELRDGEYTRFKLVDRFTNSKAELDWDTYSALMEMVVANWVEQYNNPLKKKSNVSDARALNGRKNQLMRSVNWWRFGPLFLSEPAWKALKKMFKKMKKDILATDSGLSKG